jgi:hypothetical protein
MADAPASSRCEILRSWLQTITLLVGLVAAIWGGYKALDEWRASRAERMSLSTNVAIKKIGFDPLDEQLEAIQLTITAKNTRPYSIYLLANGWAVWGLKITPNEQSDEDWLKEANKRIVEKWGQTYRYYKLNPPTLVAAGTIFPEPFLKPDEEVSRSLIVYVPRGAFGRLAVDVLLPNTKADYLRGELKLQPLRGFEFSLKQKDGRDITDDESTYSNPDLAVQLMSVYRELLLSTLERETLESRETPSSSPIPH